jgi:periplasmic protein TonB
MNRTLTVLMLSVACLAGAASCSKEPPASERLAKEPVKSIARSDTTPEPPMIPVDVFPRLIESAPIKYPEEAIARGEEATVLVQALVGKDGKVTEAAIAPEQSVPDALGKAALAAVEKWTFTPGKAKGKPVAVWIIVPVKFKLH